MLSHLRFHRRAPSNPTSPLPEPDPADDAPTRHERPDSARDVSQRSDARPQSSNSSQMPPMLPPITRVASTGSEHSFAMRDDAPVANNGSRGHLVRLPSDEDSNTGFIGGIALQTYRQGDQAARHNPAMAAGQLPESQLSRGKPPPSPINTGFAARPAITATKPAKSSSFVAPTDLQHVPGGSNGRPAGPRYASEPAPGPGSVAESQKGRKGLPFLKNPMSSLLMRRKTGHAAPETQPFPFTTTPSYDPRIRGTRVHDFSAPRPKKTTNAESVLALKSDAGASAGISAARVEPITSPPQDGSSKPISAEPVNHPVGGTAHSDGESGPVPEVDKSRKLSLEKALPEHPLPDVPPKDEPAALRSRLSSAASSTTSTAVSQPATSASVRTTASRKVSLSQASRRDSVASAVPKHMKSTSSRFSFDMIGAAKQEKLLEERHRQRAQTKKTDDPGGYRDSRYDDFDEESFDYDAMMDDGGIEEMIPGINADYEDEEDPEAALDPDNDQENFAGFVFQRSNPASSLASPNTPAMLATPRDANGKVIGFAMTKDTTPELPSAESPMFPVPSVPPKIEMDLQGLGVRGSDAPTPAEAALGTSDLPGEANLGSMRQTSNDDLYFDDGLADELEFDHDGTVFDESIFDNDDTDRFGRPIPGAFAQAKEAMKVSQQQQQPSKRDSDVTSDLSGQSAVTESTGYTSLSTGLQQPPAQQVKEAEQSQSLKPAPLNLNAGAVVPIPVQDLAYQAALAEAAQKAAASGKFRRSSSPPVPDDDAFPGAQAQESAESSMDPYLEDLNDYETDDFNPTSFEDDFDFDDEAIIAEANASALANDTDGFYGQEFGFYSAPLPIPPSAAHQPYHTPSSSTPNSSSSILSAENLYQYANGGYFGPAGVGRSASGRVVCREPNLTPITERSEYSNRNSVMSFTMPPVGSGADAGGRNSMTSPGLAQLASLLSEEGEGEDKNMSLEALMKLRSRAWGGGGSQGSSREGSPRSERAVNPLDGAAASSGSPYGYLSGGHVRANSAFVSLWAGGGADGGAGSGSGAASPTLAAAGLAMGMVPPLHGSGSGAQQQHGMNGAVVSPLPLRPPARSLFSPVPSPGQGGQALLGGSACSPVLEGEEEALSPEGGPVGELAPALPVRRATSPAGRVESSPADGLVASAPPSPQAHRAPGKGHRHKGSADSISYVKDEESGGNRWVVERRRTAESGEVEILGRKVVDGGSI